MREIKVGNKLERKRMQFMDEMPVEIWVEGTILEFDDRTVSLEYQDGTREVVERGIRELRHP